MCNLRSRCSGLLVLTVLGLFALKPGLIQAQMVDLNGNGMSDIWELIYGAANLDPKGDADGDGASNLQEATAGTNPFDAHSVPMISATALGGTNVTVSIACAPGKQYQLQSLQPFGAGGWSNWTIEATAIARAGTVLTLSAPAGSGTQFYRIA